MPSHYLERYSHYLTSTFKTGGTSLDSQIFIPVNSQFLYEQYAFLNIFVEFLHVTLLFLFL